MKKTSVKQKILLIVFGICLTLVLLEISLRIAGDVVLYLQERHNHISSNLNEYRILCLGESTTALGGEDSYPSQLEAMLNARSAGRQYTVINKGIISTTTNTILAHLDQNLEMVKPQMVIVMMGINDRAYLHDFSKTLWLENIKAYLKDFRVYKLAHLIYERFVHRAPEIEAPVSTDDVPQAGDEGPQETEDFLKLVIGKCLERYSRHMAASAQFQQDQRLNEAKKEKQFADESLKEAASACVELGRRYRFKGLYQDEQKILHQATIFDPGSADVYQEWGEFYLAIKYSAQAVKAFQAALALDPTNSDMLLGLAHAYYQAHDNNAFLVYAGYLQLKPQDYWRYIELAQWFKEKGHDELAEKYLNHAIGVASNFDEAYLDLGQLLDGMGQYRQEEAVYLKGIAMHCQSPLLYMALGQCYQKQGKKDLANSYFQKVAGQEMPEYCPATLVNYKMLLDKILSRHIKLIIMQYPLRDINILKDYLGQKNGVIFVENKQNFKQALMKEGYSHYFKDNFAYNFGHCTRAGNELIAHHLTEIISKQ